MTRTPLKPCATCPAYRDDPDTPGAGRCVAEPPVFRGMNTTPGGLHLGQWPVVRPDDACLCHPSNQHLMRAPAPESAAPKTKGTGK